MPRRRRRGRRSRIKSRSSVKYKDRTIPELIHSLLFGVGVIVAFIVFVASMSYFFG